MHHRHESRGLVFLGLSIDGCVAGAQGDLSWLAACAAESTADTGYDALMARVDTLLIVRRTYEAVLGFPGWPHAGKRVRVLTRRPLQPRDDEQACSGPFDAVMTQLAAEGARAIYLDGADVVCQALRLDLVDEMTLSWVPVLLGAGTRLFEDGLPRKASRLDGSGRGWGHAQGFRDSKSAGKRPLSITPGFRSILDTGYAAMERSMPPQTDLDPVEAPGFIAEIDAAMQAHVEWTRRILRCAVMKVSPGDDILLPDAHCRCRLGRWLGGARDQLWRIDAQTVEMLETEHRRMHDAIRDLCGAILSDIDVPGQCLDVFEVHQRGTVQALEDLKTLIVSRAARLDALTGLPMRHGIEPEFDRYRAMARRHGEDVYALLLDIDHFKDINDRFGHAVGDLALVHTAQAMRRVRRAGEPLFRFGGEEFLLLLSATGPEAAAEAAHRIVQVLRESPLLLDSGERIEVRVSGGLARSSDDDSLGTVVERADAAMYRAKREGRDRWCWSVEPLPPSALD